MTPADSRMPLHAAVAALHEARRHTDIVITTMAAAREWMTLGTGPLDLVFVPSSMGQATSVGLGLALAQPDRRVIVANGDGSMLMNLGSLVSITAAAPPNILVIVFSNGVYEVTGAQPTPGSAAGRADGTDVDLVGMARACGFRSVARFTALDAWRAALPDLISSAGPTFVVAEVAPVPEAPGPRSPSPAGARAKAFRDAVRNGTPGAGSGG